MLSVPAKSVLQSLFVLFFGVDADAGIDRSPYEREIACLAQAVWFEARGSSFADKLAVAQVVVNRVASDDHGDTVCTVVWEPAQFSWTGDGKPDHVAIENDIDESAWQDSVLAALTAYSAGVPDLTLGATHYHATYVAPDWAESLHRRGQIGAHFYYATFAPAPIVAPPRPAPR
jgi:spore germination cell wall hydrolase CwlJ-like protein